MSFQQFPHDAPLSGRVSDPVTALPSGLLACVLAGGRQGGLAIWRPGDLADAVSPPLIYPGAGRQTASIQEAAAKLAPAKPAAAKLAPAKPAAAKLAAAKLADPAMHDIIPHVNSAQI
jgi:hypothetical protein